MILPTLRDSGDLRGKSLAESVPLLDSVLVEAVTHGTEGNIQEFCGLGPVPPGALKRFQEELFFQPVDQGIQGCPFNVENFRVEGDDPLAGTVNFCHIWGEGCHGYDVFCLYNCRPLHNVFQLPHVPRVVVAQKRPAFISSSRSRLEAHTIRTSMERSSFPPILRNDRSWIARSSLLCMLDGISPTSSRNSVPR